MKLCIRLLLLLNADIHLKNWASKTGWIIPSHFVHYHGEKNIGKFSSNVDVKYSLWTTTFEVSEHNFFYVQYSVMYELRYVNQVFAN